MTVRAYRSKAGLLWVKRPEALGWGKPTRKEQAISNPSTCTVSRHCMPLGTSKKPPGDRWDVLSCFDQVSY